MENKTPKEIMFEAIDFIDSEVRKPDSPLIINLTKEHWVNFNIEQQKFYRKLLLRNRLISFPTDDFWEFKLTAEAIVAEREDYDEQGILKAKQIAMETGAPTFIGSSNIGIAGSHIITSPIDIPKIVPRQTKRQCFNLPENPDCSLKNKIIK